MSYAYFYRISTIFVLTFLLFLVERGQLFAQQDLSKVSPPNSLSENNSLSLPVDPMEKVQALPPNKAINPNPADTQDSSVKNQPPQVLLKGKVTHSVPSKAKAHSDQLANQDSTMPKVYVDQNELNKVAQVHVHFHDKAGENNSPSFFKAIYGIGQDLAGQMKLKGQANYNNKYLMHRVLTVAPNYLSADILALTPLAQIDHIWAIRVLLSSYFHNYFHYTSAYAKNLAYLTSVYNAVYYQNRDYFTQHYASNLQLWAQKNEVGLSLSYKNWPGQARIVIPLDFVKNTKGSFVGVDIASLTNDKVKQALGPEKARIIKEVQSQSTKNTMIPVKPIQKPAVQEPDIHKPTQQGKSSSETPAENIYPSKGISLDKFLPILEKKHSTGSSWALKKNNQALFFILKNLHHYLAKIDLAHPNSLTVSQYRVSNTVEYIPDDQGGLYTTVLGSDHLWHLAHIDSHLNIVKLSSVTVGSKAQLLEDQAGHIIVSWGDQTYFFDLRMNLIQT